MNKPIRTFAGATQTRRTEPGDRRPSWGCVAFQSTTKVTVSSVWFRRGPACRSTTSRNSDTNAQWIWKDPPHLS